MKKTVAQLDDELQELKSKSSNVMLHAGLCWGEKQLAAILEVYNRYGELVKLEAIRGWSNITNISRRDQTIEERLAELKQELEGSNE